MNKKYTIDYVRKEFNKESYILISTEYINTRQKLQYVCPKGHKHSISWCGWKKGDRCLYCSGLAIKNIVDIRNSFGQEKYELLEKKYVNAHTKMGCKCPDGHVYKVTWNNWQQGKRCPRCEDINFSKRFSGNNSWHWKDYSDKELQEFNNYKNEVWRLSERNYKKFNKIINPLNLLRGRKKYHLDHIYSIFDGFCNNIPANIISHVDNLQMLLERDNISKSSRSDMSIKDLYSNYYKGMEYAV